MDGGSWLIKNCVLDDEVGWSIGEVRLGRWLSMVQLVDEIGRLGRWWG